MKYISQNNRIGANKDNNKRCFSANGFSLLPLALRPCLFLSFAIVIIVTFNIRFSNNTFATNSTISVNVTQSTASLDIKPINTNGAFAKTDTNNTGITFSVTTNNFSGYNLSIAASNNGADAANLTQTVVRNAGTENEESTIYRIESLGEVEGMTSSGITEVVFSNSSNIQYNNKWGIKPNKLNSVDNTNYLPIPTSTSDSTTLDTTSIAGTNNYTIDMGARVDTDIPMGTYSNTLVITAVANLINYEITYNKGNTEDTVTNLPVNQTGVIDDPTTSSTNITLSSTKPTRTGYVFNGWCTELPTIGTNGKPDACGGTTYAISSTYDLDATISPNVTLYAMWRLPMVTWENNYSGTNLPPNEITYANGPISTLLTPIKPNTQCNGRDCFNSLKEWNTKADGSGDTVTTGITPAEDTTYYAIWNFNSNTLQATRNVATAEDGTNCAGIKYDARDGKAYNVALITGSDSKDYCFTLDNLKVDKGVTLKSGDTDIKASGVTYIDPSTNKSVTATSFTTPTESWTSSSQNYYCRAIMATAGDEYYYNWYAARANPYQCSNPTTYTNATATNDGYALGSICPAGWKLPTYTELAASILWGGGSNIGNLTLPGYYSSGSRTNVGSRGYWWSNSRIDLREAFVLYFYGTNAVRQGNFQKAQGLSVRCMIGS